MNKYNDYSKKLKCLYIEFSEHFTWHNDSKEWEPRKKREVIGQIFSCRSSDGEKFYLKILLMHIRKPTFFTDLRTINGETFTTFRETVQMLGLMENDSTADMCIQEAAGYLMPHALRQLFATVLVYCSPKKPKQLWLKFETFLSEDFKQNKALTSIVIRHKVLDILANNLYSMGKRLEDFFPASDDIIISFHDSLTKELQTERDIIISDEDLLAVGHIALATATSGVATSLLPGGRTSHSRFKIPLDENDPKPCSISKQSTLAHLIKVAKLIIWDEATMAKRSIIEKFNEMLKDIMDSHILFGGKIVLFGGDFRQTLPVILKGTKDDIIDASIIMSPL